MSPLKAVLIPTEMEGTSAAGISSRCFAELSLRSCQLRRQRKRKGWTTFRSKKSFGEGSGVVLGHSRGSEGPLALLPELLSQGSPWSEQRGLCQPPIPEPQQLPTRLFRSRKSHLWMLSLKKQQHWWVFLAWTEESFCSSYSPHADSAQQLSSSVLFLSQGFLKHHF